MGLSNQLRKALLLTVASQSMDPAFDLSLQLYEHVAKVKTNIKSTDRLFPLLSQPRRNDPENVILDPYNRDDVKVIQARASAQLSVNRKTLKSHDTRLIYWPVLTSRYFTVFWLKLLGLSDIQIATHLRWKKVEAGLPYLSAAISKINGLEDVAIKETLRRLLPNPDLKVFLRDGTTMEASERDQLMYAAGIAREAAPSNQLRMTDWNTASDFFDLIECTKLDLAETPIDVSDRYIPSTWDFAVCKDREYVKRVWNHQRTVPAGKDLIADPSIAHPMKKKLTALKRSYDAIILSEKSTNCAKKNKG